MEDKDMIERYIYEVTKRVPQDTREEIKMELKTLIEDMCEDENLTVTQCLEKLGDPYEFAKKYRDGSNYIIGPDYYDNYIWVTKLAIIGIGISSVISSVVQAIMKLDNYVKFFSVLIEQLIETAIGGACSAIGIITIIFAILEHQKVKVDIKPHKQWKVDDIARDDKKNRWHPESLLPIPDKKAIISPVESMFSIIFISVFAVLLVLQPQFFSAFKYEDGKMINQVCIFNLDEWSSLVPIFVFILVIGLIDEIVRLVKGVYCRLVMYSNIICSAIQFVGMVILFKFRDIWNPDFADELKVMFEKEEFAEGDILNYWGTNLVSNSVLAIFVGIMLLEISVTCYKTLRYSSKVN